MTPEEARQILIANRPDRPQATERRQFQKAVDVILTLIEDRNFGEWEVEDGNPLVKCSKCGGEDINSAFKYCHYCGAYMGIWEFNDED